MVIDIGRALPLSTQIALMLVAVLAALCAEAAYRLSNRYARDHSRCTLLLADMCALTAALCVGYVIWFLWSF